jgi:hypothetical protein
MTNNELAQDFGPCMTATELAEYLKVDRRTIVKYASLWGGVEVTPGTWRFFEKRIVEVINAQQGFEKRQSAIQGHRNSAGADFTKAVPRRRKEVTSSGPDMGKRSRKRTEEEAIPDKYGIFGNGPMVKRVSDRG